MNPSPVSTGPSRTLQIVNFLVFQSAWFAAVLGAAHRLPVWGTAAVALAIGWHLHVAVRPWQELKLIAIVCAIGFVVESASASLGYVVYPSGQPVAWLAPYWMVALWGLLAIAPNVTMRWLKSRYWLAALLGATLGPLSFVSGVRLGGASFSAMAPALTVMAGTWAILMPALMWLSDRFDGMGRVEPLPDA